MQHCIVHHALADLLQSLQVGREIGPGDNFLSVLPMVENLPSITEIEYRHQHGEVWSDCIMSQRNLVVIITMVMSWL